MDGINLVDLKIQGIKSLDKEVELSFYKKRIVKPIDFQNYNIKGIYGTNGSGKTAIISAVKILKDVLLFSNYLSNDNNQKKLAELINKKSKTLNIEATFLACYDDVDKPILYRYSFQIATDKGAFFHIYSESLEFKTATSTNSTFNKLYEHVRGADGSFFSSSMTINNLFFNETKNLLDNSSICSLYVSKPSLNLGKSKENVYNELHIGIVSLMTFAFSIFVYLDEKDLYDDYLLSEKIFKLAKKDFFNSKIKHLKDFGYSNNYSLTAGRNIVQKDQLSLFVTKTRQLYSFLKIFKNELCDISFDKVDNGDVYVCRLIMNYEDYDIDSEFESNGIKKLITLHQYIQRMCENNIVFIDELDSNLHDVYLCALLEYLSEYSRGQLCFTSHNIGLMRILRGKKKSIDFLSIDKSIYSWSSSGNYSPSTLYQNGMISGSPFNVDSTDFIGVFDSEDSN